MANVFKRYTAQIGNADSDTTVYTVPGGTTSVIIGLQLANKAATAITASGKLNAVSLVEDVPIPNGSTLSILDGKLIGEAGDQFIFSSSDSDSLDVIISALEQS
jgi:hypothetical protein